MLLVFICCLSASVFASAFGLPKSTLKYGVGTYAGLYSVNDPKGGTLQKPYVQPYNFIISDWLPNASKYHAEFYYNSMSFDAEADKIGQNATQYGSRISGLVTLGRFKSIHPWFGLGVDLSYSEFSERHRIDSDGFLVQQYSNRQNLNASLIMQLMNEWQIERYWDAGIKAQYTLPVTDSVESKAVAVYLMYRGF